MKKYAFRLETVRRVRRVQEAVAKAELARANGDVADAIAAVEARVATYDRKLAETNQEYANSLSGSGGDGSIVRVDAFMKRRYFNALAGHAVVAARSSLAAAQLEMQAKQEVWSEVATKVKALDRLDDRRRDEYLVEYNRAIESEVDDIVTGRFQTAQALRGETA